jgi:thiaminase
MSINVEMIGTGLVVQHYVAELHEKDHCHMVSTSDVLTPHGWTTVQVVWDLKADPIDDKTSRYTNTVTSYPTAEFMEFIARHGQTFEEAASARQASSSDHCRRETPLYAASIGRYANARK